MTEIGYILLVVLLFASAELLAYSILTFKPKTMENKDKWTFYRDHSGEWRWKRQAEGNNEIIGASSEGFTSKFNCSYNAKRNGYYGEDEIDWVDETGLEHDSEIKLRGTEAGDKVVHRVQKEVISNEENTEGRV